MRKHRIAAAAIAVGALALPATASAHNATPTVSCNTISIAYDTFAVQWFGSNTVGYREVVDGQDAQTGVFKLEDALGSQGTLSFPLLPADGKAHTVTLYTWWGPPDTQTAFDDVGGSKTAPLVTATITCGGTTTPPTSSTTTTTTATTVPVTGTSVPVTGTTTPGSGVAGTGTTTPVAQCAASLARSYRVRAGQLNQVTVVVKNGTTVKVGSKVKISAPGISVSRNTNSQGKAIFYIKPKRSGLLTVRAAGCANPASVSVLAAKHSSAARKPSYTG